MRPKIVMGNIFSDTDKLKRFSREHEFSGIDWSFDDGNLPVSPAEESVWVKRILSLAPLEIRYHCPFYQIDLGHNDPNEANKAATLFRRIILLVSKVEGRYLTIHIGLGRNSTEPLSWDATVGNLRRIVQFGADHRVTVCLENLGWGWTSRPNLFEKLIRRSGAGVTFDIGHATECESVRSQLYTMADFVTPHSGRVFNAHIYHREISGFGHTPPDHPADIEDRLSLLQEIGCEWWAIEINETEGLLKTKRVIEKYLTGTSWRKEPEAHAV